MADLSRDEALCLVQLAEGRAARGDALPALLQAGLVRLLPAEDAQRLAGYRALKDEGEQLRLELAASRRSRGLGALRSLLPAAKARAAAAARDLAERIDENSRLAQRQWLDLATRDLIGLELPLLSPCADGTCALLNESGRTALRQALYPAKDDSKLCDRALVALRTEQFLGLRGELLAAGFAADPRMDLAVALMVGTGPGPEQTDRVTRFRELNRLAVAAGWRSYDRMPLLAALPVRTGYVSETWDAYETVLNVLQERGLFNAYETRCAAAALITGPDEVDLGASRMEAIARGLRAAGWSMDQNTDPVAARLAGVRLPVAQVVARVTELLDELREVGATVGPYLTLSASVAADCSAHLVVARADGGAIMERQSPYDWLISRYLALQAHFPAQDSSGTLPPAFLAVLPGDPTLNYELYRGTVVSLCRALPPSAAAAVGLVLVQAACEGSWHPRRYVWEIGSLLGVDDPASVFTNYLRTSSVLTTGRVGASMPSAIGGPPSG